MHATHPSTLSRWELRAPDPLHVAVLEREARVDRLVAVLLANRGFDCVDRAREHLVPDLKRLHDPFLLPDMRAATRRLVRAIEAGETILVHGDYDVDGVTGTALLVRLLRLLRAKVVWHIPNRLTDGYSFGEHTLERVRATGARVVVSVDNGTSAGATIQRLAELGVDTVVTDHHEPPLGTLPPAAAIVNPKLVGSGYPFRELCGGAVAFKLAWGLAQEVSGADRVRANLREFLIDAMSYVAVATVCDVVPLVEENRILARFGLLALEHTRTPGLVALLELAGLGGRRLSAEDVAFQVGPRLNASGRLGSANDAVELLLAEDVVTARALARRLDAHNVERRLIEREVLERALEQAQRYADPARWPVLVVAGEGWHSGVVGIVAARLVERFHRPALVIGLEGGRGRGSARSVPGFDVLEVLHAAEGVFDRYGGHAQAAGCELSGDAVDRMREAVCARASRMLAERPLAHAALSIDCEVPLPAMNEACMRRLEALAPFGERNEKPLLYSSDVRLAEPARRVGQDADHLLIHLRRGDHVLKALGFGMGARAEELRMGVPLHVVYTPRWNTFRGETSLELTLSDFRVGERPGLFSGAGAGAGGARATLA